VGTDDASGQERTPVYYLDWIRRKDAEPERAVLHSREDNKVYVRAVDPCDDPPAERIPLYEGDELIAMDNFSHIGHHTTPEGSEGYLLPQRIVPTGREEPGKVFARTLRYGEPDDGRRVHVRPGDVLSFDDGALSIQIDYVDEWEGQGVTGYVPLTPVLFTWMCFGTYHSDEKRRYLLSAARRLDRAQTHFERVGELREQLQQDPPEGAPAVRRAVFDLIGTTELALVALNRAMDMCVNAGTDIGATTTVPDLITNLRACVVQIRDAYEHIDERAVGEVRRNPNVNALSIFDHERVVADGVITYSGYYLDLATDVPDLITATRQYLKNVAAEALPANPSTPTNAT
jgi:hypothetical protein